MLDGTIWPCGTLVHRHDGSTHAYLVLCYGHLELRGFVQEFVY